MRARAFPTQQPNSMLNTTTNNESRYEPLVEVDHRRGYGHKSASLHTESTGRPSPGSLSDILGTQTPNSGQFNTSNTGGVYSASPFLQHNMPPPLTTTSDAYPPVHHDPPIIDPHPPNIQPDTGHAQLPFHTHTPGPPSGLVAGQAFDSDRVNRANFNFSAGQNGWNGLGNLQPVDSAPSIPPSSHLPTYNAPPAHHHIPVQAPGGTLMHDPYGGHGVPANASASAGGFPVNESQAGEVGFDWLNWLSTANVTMSDEGMGHL